MSELGYAMCLEKEEELVARRQNVDLAKASGIKGSVRPRTTTKFLVLGTKVIAVACVEDRSMRGREPSRDHNTAN